MAKRKTRRDRDPGGDRRRERRVGRDDSPRVELLYKAPPRGRVLNRVVVRERDIRRPRVPGKVVALERVLIKRKKVAAIMSRLSPVKCSRKRAIVRRKYFGFKTTGRKRTNLLRSANRFTVRC